MTCLVCLYSEYLVNTNKALPFLFKALNASLRVSAENRTVFWISIIMHYAQSSVSVSFLSFFFYLTDTGYASNFFSKPWLQHSLLLYLKISASCSLSFFFWRDYSPVSCPILSSHKGTKTCLVSTFKALKTCQTVRSKFPQSHISVVFQRSPLCPITSSHQLWHPNTDWCCYF